MAIDRRSALENDLLLLESSSRVALAQLVVGIIVGAGTLATLLFYSRTLQIYHLRQVSDPFAEVRGRLMKAAPNLKVRLDDIYALERIARDSVGSADRSKYLAKVDKVLSDYVRENDRKTVQIDIQIAQTIIGRLNKIISQGNFTELNETFWLLESERNQFINNELKPFRKSPWIIADRRLNKEYGKYTRDPDTSSWRSREASRYIIESYQQKEFWWVKVSVGVAGVLGFVALVAAILAISLKDSVLCHLVRALCP